ncbi:MAG: Flp/Fap pilin component [Actinomycetota bacterium]|jgi:Flp pilus assembly pilin Flp|nr:Flp/Fap pilin component [Actinomycetota bacterium]
MLVEEESGWEAIPPAFFISRQGKEMHHSLDTHHRLDVISCTVLRLRVLRSEAGASLVEYTLLVGLIALVCALALAIFGTSLNGTLSRSGSSIRHAG